jgi:pentatricopeptide repeat protein
MGHEAVDLYRRIPVDFRNETADICVLNACSHSGLIHEAHSIFNEIKVKTEKIITTMVCETSMQFCSSER